MFQCRAPARSPNTSCPFSLRMRYRWHAQFSFRPPMKKQITRREMLIASAQIAGVAALGGACASARKDMGPQRGILFGDVHGAKTAEQIYASGGNAVDAIVAAAFVAGIG